MRRLLILPLLAFSLLAQGGQPINIPIPNPPSELGYGGSVSIDLGVTPAELQEYEPGYAIDGVFLLTFSTQNAPESLSYPGYLQGEIDFGSQELCPFEGWATRNVIQVSVTCGSPAYLVIDQALPGGGPAQGGNDLVLHLYVPGWSIQFGNWSMIFMPQS